MRFLVARVMVEGCSLAYLWEGDAVHPALPGWSCNKELSYSLRISHIPGDIHVNEDAVCNYLSLEYNCILIMNTKYFCFVLTLLFEVIIR